MEITKICPKCRNEEKINGLWRALFNEDYQSFHQEVEKIKTSQWMEELPKVLSEIQMLEAKSKFIENELPQDKILELKSINQKLVFLYGRITYNQK